MTDLRTRPVDVIVVGVEDLFYELIQQFQADKYRIRFAADPREAELALDGGLPGLLAVPWSHVLKAPPAYLARARAGGCAVLGVDAGLAPPEPEWPRALVDGAAGLGNRAGAVQAALALLGERRQRPRVSAALPIRLGALGPAELRDLSATSLLVETMASLELEQRVTLEAEWGHQRVSTTARVLRLLPGSPPQVVLQLEDGDPAIRILDRLVRRALELAHYEQLDPAEGTLQGPVAWQLARRAERALRQTRELRGLGNTSGQLEAGQGGLEARYLPGAHLGQWGVGEVMRAEERVRGRPVTLKRLDPDRRQDGPARARMEMEARIGSTLADLSGVAGVLDFGSDGDGGLYYAMEGLEGQRLADALEGGQRFGDREIARLGTHLALALHEAAGRGLHHGDLCPENVFLQRASEGTVRPLLLGFASDLPAMPADETHAQGSAYWPPGSAESGADEAWDAYALSALLGGVLARGGDLGPAGDPATPARTQLAETLARGASPVSSERFSTLLPLARALYACVEALDAAIAGPPALVALPALPAGAEVGAPPLGGPAAPEAPEAHETFEDLMAEPTTPAAGSPERDGTAVSAGAAEAQPPLAPPRRARRWGWGRRLANSGVAAAAGVALVLLLGSPRPADRSTLDAPADHTPAMGSATRPADPQGSARGAAPAVTPRTAPAAVPSEAQEAKEREAARIATESPPATATGAPTAEDQAPTEPLPPGAPPEPAPEPPASADTAAANRATGPVRLSPYQRRRAYIRLSRWLLAHGAILRARRYLTKALKHGDEAEIRWLFTKSYQDTGQPWPAIWHLRKAIDLAPTVAQYREVLGQLYLSVGQQEKACAALLAAQARGPNRPVATALHRQHCGPLRTASR